MKFKSLVNMEDKDMLGFRFAQFLHCCGLEIIESRFQEQSGTLGEALISIRCKTNGKGYQEIEKEMYDRELVIEQLKRENKELKETLKVAKIQYETAKVLMSLFISTAKDGSNEKLN